MHSLVQNLTIKVIDCYLYLIYYIDSTEQIKCSKTKSLNSNNGFSQAVVPQEKYHKTSNKSYTKKPINALSINQMDEAFLVIYLIWDL